MSTKLIVYDMGVFDTKEERDAFIEQYKDNYPYYVTKEFGYFNIKYQVEFLVEAWRVDSI